MRIKIISGLLLAAAVLGILATVFPQHAILLRSAAALPVLFSVYTLVNNAKAKTPYEKEIFKNSWVRDEGEFPTFYIRISASEHKKGKHPLVIFLPVTGPSASTSVVYDIGPDGDIIVRSHPNSTMNPFKEFKVRISATQ